MSAPLLAFLFVASHAICDFALQPDPMVIGKNRHRRDLPAHLPRWWWWLSAHGLVHGAGVTLIVVAAGFPELWWLGLLETFSHVAIDDAKCAGRISLGLDQTLHYACKAAWLAVILAVR